MHSKVSLFIIIECHSKQLNERCIFGVYNRNALYTNIRSYWITTSADNLCFGVADRDNYASLNLKTSSEIYKLESRDNAKVLDITGGFM